MNIGIVFGGYCPLHKGHMDVIMRAKKNNDKVILVVCGYNNEHRANQLGADLYTRTYYIKEFFKSDEIIDVISINDTEIGLDESCSENNWRIWTDTVFKKADDLGYNKSDHIFTFYVSESNYYGMLHNKLGYNCVYTDKKLKISGTEIRNNPVKYWDYIMYPFKKFLVKPILVIGTASEGKTTIVKDISRYFNIPVVYEYGREYMEDNGITHDSQLNINDFKEFIEGQYDDISTKIYFSEKPFVICDTDNLITMMYASAYAEDPNMPHINKEDVDNILYPEMEKYIDKIKWDRIFFIEPGGKFVDDGSRYMGQASMEERKKNYSKLLELVNRYYGMEKVTFLNAGEYYQNFLTVKDYIENETSI